ncbi:hypothetical protein B0H63DRAFT_526031 [Podospora didyma]|uniref:Luciferase domain-containing protein n=1 Tax=Podospora didyma TaxID=330526 RepID=A0AAE0KDW2_9PEZI|nr:hypothetical protein B0H63DRAFT_526031 [Podospora didyma]
MSPGEIIGNIEAGWGERHKLSANDNWLFRYYFRTVRRERLPVPGGLTLLYAPRNEDEIYVFASILQAGIWYATRGELYPISEDTEYPPVPNDTDEPQDALQVWVTCHRKSFLGHPKTLSGHATTLLRNLKAQFDHVAVFLSHSHATAYHGLAVALLRQVSVLLKERPTAALAAERNR